MVILDGVSSRVVVVLALDDPAPLEPLEEAASYPNAAMRFGSRLADANDVLLMLSLLPSSLSLLALRSSRIFLPNWNNFFPPSNEAFPPLTEADMAFRTSSFAILLLFSALRLSSSSWLPPSLRICIAVVLLLLRCEGCDSSLTLLASTSITMSRPPSVASSFSVPLGVNIEVSWTMLWMKSLPPVSFLLEFCSNISSSEEEEDDDAAGFEYERRKERPNRAHPLSIPRESVSSSSVVTFAFVFIALFVIAFPSSSRVILLISLSSLLPSSSLLPCIIASSSVFSLEERNKLIPRRL
mmetsp:Transcript_19793/g.37196  ORF Transcript_19793/g.37196 Transcript_19793/m.37196 type:complete len:297 (-) Transcript_19793:54-944(-)